VRLFPGVIGLFFLIGGWLFLQKEWAGSEFVATQIKEQTLDRFLSGSHKAPFWYYFPRLFTSIFLPWGVFLFPAALRLKRFGRQLPSGMAALIGWIVFPFLVLTLAAGKRQSYLLPLLPALALIVGWYLNQVMIEKKYYPRLGNSLKNLLFIVGGGILFLSILIGIVPSMLDRYGLAIHHFGCILSAFWGTLIMSLGVWIDKGEKRSSQLFAGLACLVMVLSLLQFSVINPAMNPLKTTKPFALMLNKMTLDLHLSQIGTIGRANKPEYHVYGNYRLVTYKTDDVVENPSALLPVLVGREEEWEEISRSITLKDYKPVWAGEVSRDKIVVYIKDDGQN
jgi:4-amino-4-deoxy-L-arabinose transferase-like glycosyltransferase